MVKNRPNKLDDETIIEGRYFSEYDIDDPMTTQEIVVAMELILETLNVSENTADLVCEILSEDLWSMRKLRDAIKYVVKTHRYKEVKPANILSYDKEIPFYSYNEMLELGSYGFCCVIIPGLPNMKRKTDSIKGEIIDVGWYVRSNKYIPESWRPWGTST